MATTQIHQTFKSTIAGDWTKDNLREYQKIGCVYNSGEADDGTTGTLSVQKVLYSWLQGQLDMVCLRIR